MKRSLIFALLFFCANAIFGQTYYYKYLYHVNRTTGVKEKKWQGDNKGIYMTFTNGMQYCYQSDKDGLSGLNSEAHIYIGEDENKITYHYSYKNTLFLEYLGNSYYNFSPDYSRLNWWNEDPNFNYIAVFERAVIADPKDNAPDRMW
jgi:hypothetical protein